MSLTLLVGLFLGAVIAYANGSNDVSKSIATLVGSGVTSYRRAIAWGTVWTGIGGVAGSLFAGAMVATFGKGLLSPGVHPTFVAAIATLAGAAAWVGFSTRTGLPVSTTHAIVGSITGVGVLAYGFDGVHWAAFGTKIALPLLVSPILALSLTALILKVWRLRASTTPVDCVCAEVVSEPITVGLDGTVAAFSGPLRLDFTAASTEECERTLPRAARITASRLHWLTSAATGMARGLNDAPKMVALVIAAVALTASTTHFDPAVFVIVAVGMVIGSWVAGLKVTTVLAEKVTPMDHQEGFVANLVTAALVGPGAALGLPMSTTHVSSGAIMGVATKKGGRIIWKTVNEMLLAWIVTLPGAALLGIMIYLGLEKIGLR